MPAILDEVAWDIEERFHILQRDLLRYAEAMNISVLEAQLRASRQVEILKAFREEKGNQG